MITEHLATGKHNAIKAQDLADMLGCSKREIISTVQMERRQGKPICVNLDRANGGYYLPDTPDDLEHTCNILRKRAGELYATRKPLLKALKEMKENNTTLP